MSAPDGPAGPNPLSDPVNVAREIAAAAASLGARAEKAGLEVLAQLLNLVRIEAEIKLNQIRFRPPDGPQGRSTPDERN